MDLHLNITQDIGVNFMDEIIPETEYKILSSDSFN